MNYDLFEQNMAVFSFRQHQDFLTYFETLNQFGYSIRDVQNYIEKKRSELKAANESKSSPAIKCLDCGSRILILPVNDKPSTQTGDDSKSVMMCQNRQCMYTKYSVKTVGEWIKELSKK